MSQITTSQRPFVVTSQVRLNGGNNSADNNNNNHCNNNILSNDLRKILSEVARNGGSSTLSWFGNHATPTRIMKFPNGKRRRPTALASSQIHQQTELEEYYECDSEGTLSTNNSELDAAGHKQKAVSCLSDAFSISIAVVLDHSYRTQGGYKLSPAEVRRNKGKNPLSPEQVFQQRKRLLLSLLHKPPPFTIQRVAEVLLNPERYYRQTHKLCNCLEKLLLVTSSIHSFGGSIGGQTSQSRREERELAALTDERDRQESEQRNRRLRRRGDSSEDGALLVHHTGGPGHCNNNTNITNQHHPDEVAKGLRHKFDHTAASATPQDIQRNMTTSPPPPGGMTNMWEVVAPSPILFMDTPQRHLLQIHPAAAAAAAMAGIGANSTNQNSDSTSPLDIVIEPNLNNATTVNSATTATASSSSAAAAVAPTNHASLNADADIEPDRSSPSNSDVDSESDDSVLDDSASDRSDGSEGGYEPFSAARVIALNRVAQRLRVLGEFRPPADAEYQSSDSIDSTMAEDSGGSDSSSSDLAD